MGMNESIYVGHYLKLDKPLPPDVDPMDIFPGEDWVLAQGFEGARCIFMPNQIMDGCQWLSNLECGVHEFEYNPCPGTDVTVAALHLRMRGYEVVPSYGVLVEWV